LSATPNGKNHMDATNSPLRRHLRHPQSKTIGSQNHRISPGRIPPRSHNSLLHNCPSTTATGGQVTLR